MFHHLSMGHGLELPEDSHTCLHPSLSLYVNLGSGQKVMKIDVRDSSPGTCWVTTFCANGLILASLAASFCLLLRGSGGRPRGNRTPWVCWRLAHLCTGRIHWNTAIMCDFMVFISSSRPTGDCGIWKMIVYSTENLRYGWAVLFWVRGKARILSGVLPKNSKVFLWQSPLLLPYVRPVGLDSLDWLRIELKTIMVFSIWYQNQERSTSQSTSTNYSVSSFFHHLNWQPTHLRKSLVEVCREVSQHTTEPA